MPQLFDHVDLRLSDLQIARAVWAESAASLDAILPLLQNLGALSMEGPFLEEPGYYAIFFEDPFGNRLEVRHREGS
jgi:hypothetical protein